MFTTAQILSRLQKLGSRENVAGMARFGIAPAHAFGVPSEPIRRLAREIGRDSVLAGQLWDTGIHEARILAAWLIDPASMTQKDMERWARGFDSWAVCDHCCIHLFRKTALTGTNNVAVGDTALGANTTGSFNTALGDGAAASNAVGGLDTAVGSSALHFDIMGSNTAVGYRALYANTTGLLGTAIGMSALQSNTTGQFNTAAGGGALENNTTGSNNTAGGTVALTLNTVGNYNVAYGQGALMQNTTGSNNIAIGRQAAVDVSGGNSNNIHIGSLGTSSDNGVIRIGDPKDQVAFFAAGIRGATTSINDAVPVVIDSSGQLGTVNSSRRFKEDIQDMGDASRGILRLRPVTFRYQKPFDGGSKPIQYGLIAEEVADVFPDLVARSAAGQIETVKYQVLDSLLLNEVQRQQLEITSQKDQILGLKEQINELKAAFSWFEMMVPPR